ncbi:hypothetical protein IWX49DRAFT_586730 [Phyllosticta citricarpa]|uniref:C2H2-type domain-containing protein n=2 Tax=Phyllosticta TaxID=121621 RepID=A0ABR1MQR1_9PEZI
MASKRSLEGQESDCPQPKRPKTVEDPVTSDRLTSLPPTETIDVDAVSAHHFENQNSQDFISLPASHGEIDFELLESLIKSDSNELVNKHVHHDSYDATPPQAAHSEFLNVNACLEHQPEYLAAHTHGNFATTSSAMDNDNLERVSREFRAAEGLDSDSVLIEAELFKHEKEGCNLCFYQTTVGETMAAAAPTTNGCSLMLSELESQVISTFDFDSPPGEEQTLSNFLAQYGLLHCVEGWTIPEQDSCSMAPPASQCNFQADHEADIVFYCDDKQNQPVGTALDEPSEFLQPPAVQGDSNNVMTPPRKKYRNIASAKNEDPAEPRYMPESKDINMKHIEDEKPFRCNHCDKRFKLAKSVRRHEKAEHTDCQISCPHCKLTFKRNDSLLVHARKCHGVELPHKRRDTQGLNRRASATPPTPSTPSTPEKE